MSLPVAVDFLLFILLRMVRKRTFEPVALRWNAEQKHDAKQDIVEWLYNPDEYEEDQEESSEEESQTEDDESEIEEQWMRIFESVLSLRHK